MLPLGTCTYNIILTENFQFFSDTAWDMPYSDLGRYDSETDDQIGHHGVYWIQNVMYQGFTQDHQIRKLLKDVRHSSGEIIDCNGETDNDVPPVTKMREHAKIALSPSQTSSSSSGYETTDEEEITRTRENRFGGYHIDKQSNLYSCAPWTCTCQKT